MKYENLQLLSKEQLIYLIEKFHYVNFMIGETLVENSKQHITNQDAIDYISDYSNQLNKYKLYDKHLSSFIDWQMGKISREEYKDIILG